MSNDILAVYEVDRLSRADPWDTVRYLHDLQRSGITLYCDSYGFIDWDEHYGFEILACEAVFANRWLNRLKKGRVDAEQQRNLFWTVLALLEDNSVVFVIREHELVERVRQPRWGGAPKHRELT